MAHRPIRRITVPVLLTALLAVVAAACGGSSETPAAGPTGTTQPQGVSATDHIIEDAGPPRSGGSVTYALEAESDGFNPVKNRWAISGTMVGLAVYDTLAAYNDKAEVRPYLAEAFEHNADYTQWTIKLRPNVSFTNGTPLTSAAIKTMLEGHLNSLLTKPAFRPVQTIETPDPLTAVITMSGPWVAFPNLLTSQAGCVPAPESINDDGANPIGTGPFKQVEWQRGKSWKGTKNTSYWRPGLPYLDGVEFQPIPEQLSRTAALESGTVNMMHTTDPKAITKFRAAAERGEVQMVEDRGEGEESFLIINQQKPPFDDVEMRRALAYATDTESYNADIDQGVPTVANGVMQPSGQWWVETPDYPEYDLAKAKELVETYKQAHGGQAPKVTLAVGQDSAQNAAYLQNMWQQAGFDVTTRPVEQSSFILDAIQGKYSVNLWRQFGSLDPDYDWIWWHSENAGDAPEGGLTLNIARMKDPCVDAALVKGRTNPDPAARKAAYADLQRCFARDVPYVWLNHTIWAVVADTKVRGITNGPLPDGEPSLPIGGAGDFGGVTRLTQTWLTA